MFKLSWPLMALMIITILFEMWACGEADPCVKASPMCIEAGPPEPLRAWIVDCIGSSEAQSNQVTDCMEAGYALHCTRMVRITGVTYFTQSGPRYDATNICPELRPERLGKGQR